MIPWKLAAEWQQKHCPNERLIEAVAKCVAGGFVHISNDLFVIGWEGHWDDEQKKITTGQRNAWVCQLAAGTNVIAKSMRVLPWKHEWLVWQRNDDGRWRAHRWDKLAKHYGGK